MSPRPIALVLLALCFLVPAAPGSAGSGLPIPRFVTLRADEVNVRTGPGMRYPVDWVFVRPMMPVEVIAEFDTWRKIRDIEGIEGWVHQSLLSGRRGATVIGHDLWPLLADPDEAATVVARVEPGVIGRLLRCPAAEAAEHAWCFVEVAGYRGWMARAGLWGLYDGEEVK